MNKLKQPEWQQLGFRLCYHAPSSVADGYKKIGCQQNMEKLTDLPGEQHKGVGGVFLL